MQAYLGVEHTVGGQNVEEVLLSVVVSLPEHLVVAVGPKAEIKLIQVSKIYQVLFNSSSQVLLES